MQEPSIGNVIMDDSCRDTHVVNEMDVPVLVMGGKSLVVAASPEGILVSDKDSSSHIKPYVEISPSRLCLQKNPGAASRLLMWRMRA